MKQLLLILLVAVIIIPSCRYMWGKRIRGNGNIQTREHPVADFKDVHVSGAIDLYVAQGSLKPVNIETDENLQQYIEVLQEGNRIEIRSREGINLRPTHKIKAYISAALYHSIHVSGACSINGMSRIANAEDIQLQVSGAGNIKMEINAPAIRADVSGAGTVSLKGETKTLDLDLTGAAKAHCYELLSENTKVDISGAGNAEVYASEKLDAQVSGAGSIRYKGGATHVAQQVSGAGSVKKAD